MSRSRALVSKLTEFVTSDCCSCGHLESTHVNMTGPCKKCDCTGFKFERHGTHRDIREGDGQPGYDLPPESGYDLPSGPMPDTFEPDEEGAEVAIATSILDIISMAKEHGGTLGPAEIDDIERLAQQIVDMHDVSDACPGCGCSPCECGGGTCDCGECPECVARTAPPL